MEKLLKGVELFQAEVFKNKAPLFESLADEGQHPRILFITCSDSRIDPVLFTQSEPGDLFIIRNAGNLVPPYTGNTCGEAASIEYAVQLLGVEHIIICGHSHCGALCHLIEHHEHLFDEHIPMMSKWLRYADATRTITEAHWQELPEEQRIPFATETNIVVQLKHLATHPAVAQAMSVGKLELHGWLYHVESGMLTIYDQASGQFKSLTSKSGAAR